MQALDELQAVLYFGIQPEEQQRLRTELITALQRSALTNLKISRWVRILTYQYSLEPLSCVGSLQQIGGRFNADVELDQGTLNPCPAQYMPEDYENAFREKFQLAQDATDLNIGRFTLNFQEIVSTSSLACLFSLLTRHSLKETSTDVAPSPLASV